MAPALAVPAPDGEGSSFSGYEEHVSLWPQVTNLELHALILQVSDVPPQVRMASGKGRIMNDECAQRILAILRVQSAPRADDAIYEEVVRLSRYKRLGPTMDAYLLEPDVLRRKSDARMVIGGGVPEASWMHYCPKMRSLWF